MQLHELFDKPIDGVTSKGDDHTFFIDGDGPYTVHFFEDDPALDTFDTHEEAAEWIESQIPDRDPKVYGMSFYYKSSGYITGIQDPYKVFATVLNITKKLIADNNVDFIAFEAKETEPSRIKLYQRMAKTLGKDFRTFEDAPRNSVVFVVRVS
jgi:hypothetical protein